jgi:peptidylprolyl isomerase
VDPSASPTAPVEKVAVPVTFSLARVVAGFQKGLGGQSVGSRVLIGVAPEDGYPDGNPNAGIAAGSTLFFVVDIVDASLPSASGTPGPENEWAQKIKITDDAAGMKLEIPKVSPPKEMVAAVITEGTGPVLEAPTLVSSMVGYSWQEGKAIDPWKKYDVSDTSKILPDLQKALVGKKLGSRVLVIMPPSEGSFPEGANVPPVTKGDTVVYVVDLLFQTDYPESYLTG